MPGLLRNPAGWLSTGDPSTVSEAVATAFAPGQVGTIFDLNTPALIDTGLAPGIYQFVLRDGDDATTLLLGGVMHWSDYDTFEVTQDESAAVGGTGGDHVAGVAVNASWAAGEYGLIQVGGIGPVRLVDSPTATATALGLPVVGGTTDGKADVVADWNDSARQVFAKTISAKDAGSIGTHVIEALLFPTRHSW